MPGHAHIDPSRIICLGQCHLGLAYGNIGKPPFWASYAYVTLMSNEEKELTAKATSANFDNPILSNKWFAEVVAAFEAAAAAAKEDIDYVDCGYCCNQTANPSGICTRCLKAEGQWE